MATVQRLSALATLDAPAETLARARAQADAGDESWERWVAEYQRGEAIIVRLEVAIQLLNGTYRVLETSNRGVFLEKDIHPPMIEQQIAELASKDFPALARKLAIHGLDMDPADLAQMYVHVELDDDVRRTLSGRGAERQAARPGHPESTAALSNPPRVTDTPDRQRTPRP